MINAIIIDDEPNNIKNLELLLRLHCPEVKVVSTALNADEGIIMITQFKPELVFLDIQMPGKNGFELLQSLQDYSFEVIFVTAYDQYGIQAVKFAAIDYLLKPINTEELKIAVQKAVKRNSDHKQNVQLENLIRLLEKKQDKEEHRLVLPTSRETRFVPTQQIIRCESSNNYTTFYLESGEKLMVSKPIYEYEELLSDYGFVRCHQSHIINKKFIKSWMKEEGGYLLLQDNTHLPISKQKREFLRNSLSKK
ncbi:MAG: response regulator transcription factor [Chitinophagaceae bacterium]|nr:response regulator transcription factor [Chitinophagaceae bacterium]